MTGSWGDLQNCTLDAKSELWKGVNAKEVFLGVLILSTRLLEYHTLSTIFPRRRRPCKRRAPIVRDVDCVDTFFIFWMYADTGRTESLPCNGRSHLAGHRSGWTTGFHPGIWGIPFTGEWKHAPPTRRCCSLLTQHMGMCDRFLCDVIWLEIRVEGNFQIVFD